MNKDKLALAIVGYGGIGSYHANVLITGNEENIYIKGTYDIDDVRQHKASVDGYQVYESFEALLADEAVDAVLISTPNDSHKDLSIQALQAGKHVICEKPVTLNLKEFDEILEIAEREAKTFMVHQNRRWDPDYLLVRDLYKEKTIGDIFKIESRVHGSNGIPGDWRHMREHGGGMLLDWGVHLLDQILWLVDSPVKDVKADLSYILGEEVDDGFTAYLTFEDGTRVLTEVGTTNYATLPRWYIQGNQGSAIIKDWDLNGEMVIATGAELANKPVPIQAGVGLTKTMAPPVEGVVEKVALPAPKLDYPSFYENFYEVVTKGAEPIVKNEEVYRVMEIIEKVFSMMQIPESINQ